VYNAAISVETCIEVERIFLGGPNNTPSSSSFRHRMYFLSAFVLTAVSVGYLNLTGSFGFSNENKVEAHFCSEEGSFLLTLAPFAVSTIIVCFCNFRSLRAFRHLLSGSELQFSISAQSRCALIRLIIVPIWPLLVYIPSGVLYFKEDKSETIGMAWDVFGIIEALLFPSAGTIVAIIFVFTDCKQMHVMWKRLGLFSLALSSKANNSLSQSLLYDEDVKEWQISIENRPPLEFGSDSNNGSA